VADLGARPLTPKAARRLLLQHVKRARQCLAARPGDEQIHRARKRIKKARALLRLLEPSMGRRTFARTEGALRAAAKPLSSVRDSKILTETFDRLMKSRAKVRLKGREHLHQALARHHRQVRAAVSRDPHGVTAARRALDRARKSCDGALHGGRGALLKSPGRLYRAGRRALAASRREAAVDTLHAWRKCAKYLSHQLEALGPHCPAQTRLLARELHSLSDELGEDHDLAMLRAHLAGHPEALADAEERADLVRLIEEARLERQERVLRNGARLYARPPKLFRSELKSGCRRAPRPAP